MLVVTIILVVVTVAVVATLDIAHRKHKIDDRTFNKYAAIATIVGGPLTLLSLIVALNPSSSPNSNGSGARSPEPVLTPGPVLVSTPPATPTATPASTASQNIPATSSTPGANEERVRVRKGETKGVFGNELSIAVNDVTITDLVTATVGSNEQNDLVIERQGVGYSAPYRGKRAYKIRIMKVEYVGSAVEFLVTIIKTK